MARSINIKGTIKKIVNIRYNWLKQKIGTRGIEDIMIWLGLDIKVYQVTLSKLVFKLF